MTRIGRKYSLDKNTIENDAYFSELFRILFAMNTLTVIAHSAWYAPNSFKTAIASVYRRQHGSLYTDANDT